MRGHAPRCATAPAPGLPRVQHGHKRLVCCWALPPAAPRGLRVSTPNARGAPKLDAISEYQGSKAPAIQRQYGTRHALHGRHMKEVERQTPMQAHWFSPRRKLYMPTCICRQGTIPNCVVTTASHGPAKTSGARKDSHHQEDGVCPSRQALQCGSHCQHNAQPTKHRT